jgi:hypothetical protein
MDRVALMPGDVCRTIGALRSRWARHGCRRCRQVAEFFANFLGDAVKGTAAVVEAPGDA